MKVQLSKEGTRSNTFAADEYLYPREYMSHDRDSSSRDKNGRALYSAVGRLLGVHISSTRSISGVERSWSVMWLVLCQFVGPWGSEMLAAHWSHGRGYRAYHSDTFQIIDPLMIEPSLGVFAHLTRLQISLHIKNVICI